MKKTKRILFLKQALLAGAISLASFNSQAQSGLTNLSFENWTTQLFGPAPTGWFGFNVSQQTSAAQQGGKYVRISNTSNGEGILMLGTVNSFSGTVTAGEPYTQNPVSITGFYKTSGLAAGDVIGITAFTSKSGTVNSVATFTQNTNVANWTSFSLIFSNYMGTVDSLFIYASSGNINGGDNSAAAILDVDNLTITSSNPTTGIDIKSNGTSFAVFPNPASSELNIISKDEKATTVFITAMDGRIVGEQTLSGESTQIDLRNYEEGIYCYSILDKNKSVLLTNRLIIVH